MRSRTDEKASAELDGLYGSIQQARIDYRLPAGLRPASIEISQRVLGLLFPHYQSLCTGYTTPQDELASIGKIVDDTILPLLEPSGAGVVLPHQMLFDQLPHVRQMLLEDAAAIWSNDPAAESLDEVILAYPGFMAVALHRIAHVVYLAGVPIFPRLIAEYAHQVTAVDIHPGAQIGRSFSIDHGTGVVIGETTVIGDHVRLFQGVTLGALTVRKELADTKRHPTLEDNVVVYAGATILGGKTVIGRNSVIGGNCWITESVPPDSVVSLSSTTRKKEDAILEFYI